MLIRIIRHPLFLLSIAGFALGALVACSSAPKHENPAIAIERPNAKPAPKEPQKLPSTQNIPVQTPVATPSPKPITVTPTAPIAQEKRHYHSFDEWKNDFISRLISQGYNQNSVYQLMNGASLNNQVIALDNKQAEFSKMPWEYVESAASNTRVNKGKNQLNEYPSLLTRLENQYGVPKEIVVAIWGMESSYGVGTGNMNLINALSSLAYDGRRRAFAEGELIAMLKMIERGDVMRSDLVGSWAGGMGHTQFIPSTWLTQGVDGNNDGHKNPWTISDALSSTANYLSNSGWIRNVDAFYEVRLPSGFNHNLIGQKQSLSAWQNSGLHLVSGGTLSGDTEAELWLPGGIYGPAILITPNFDVIKVYNNSSNYALGVALLGKRISGKSGIIASWPRHESSLSSAQIKRLQQTLTSLGYDTGGTDGVAGANTRRAFARWQKDNNKIPDGFISQSSAGSLIW